MVMGPFHTLLRDRAKDIRESGRRISPTDLLKVSGLGEKITVSDLTPPYKSNNCMVAVLNGQYRKTCKLKHQAITDAHDKNLL